MKQSKKRILSVWMNGSLVGWWSVTSRGIHEFRYDESWLASPLVRPISLSMPLRHHSEAYRGTIVESYFDNLLPNNLEIRQRLKRRFQTAGIQSFALLKAIGRDCVGAVQLLPQDEKPGTVKRITGKALTDGEIAELLRFSGTFPETERPSDNFRISIAGAQEKTAFLLHKNTWYLPEGATPTTHIFKLPLGPIGRNQIDLSTSVENEWLCSRILKAYGIPCAATDIHQFDDQKVLVVERFDRRISGDGSWIIRIPQEDMCQVKGIPPDMKYESDGGPGIESIMNLLFGSRNSVSDRKIFFKTQIVYWMLSAIDGHAKNFSVFLEPGGSFSLTPVYDVLSAFPVLGHGKNAIPPEKLRMAMAVQGNNNHYRWSRIASRHWISMGKACGYTEKTVTDILSEILDSSPDAIETAADEIPASFPSYTADKILHGLAASVEKLKSGY